MSGVSIQAGALRPERALDADACVDVLTDACLRTLPPQLSVPGAGLYLLIDPLLGDPVLQALPEEGLEQPALNALRAAAWQRSTFALTLPAAVALDTALAPYLVELHGPDDPWLASSVQWAVQETVHSWMVAPAPSAAHRVGGWLQSSAFGPQLARALSGWLQVSTEARTTAHYLRLADRRVLSLLVHVLGPAAVAQRLAPAQHWHWLDPHAAWVSLAVTQESVGEIGPAAWPSDRAWPLATFSQAQWDLMARGDEAHGHIARSEGARSNCSEATSLAHRLPVSAAQWQAALSQADDAGKHTREEASA